MDTSFNYIKMCEKAVEVQELWKGNERDFTHNGSIVEILGSNKESWRLRLYNYTWLPSQDQLQGMVGLELFHLIQKFYDWHIEDKRDTPFTSMEQLWLAFVMSEKFNKTWNGTDWIQQPN